MKKQNNINYTIPSIVNKGRILNKNEIKQKNFKITTICLVIFMVILLLFSGYCFAKIIDETIIKANTGVAEPILIIENNPSIDITATQNYGIYTFKVKNYNSNNKITEVDLKYYIEILANVDDTINFKLYENEKEINLNNQKTEYINISKNKKEEREYKIEIEYDKTLAITDILEKVQVKVHTEQVKA